MPDAYSLTFGGEPVVSVDTLARSCDDHELASSHFMGKCNGYVCPLGAKPGMGYVLMRAESLDKIKKEKEFDLVYTYYNPDGSTQKPVQFRDMVIVSNEVAVPGRKATKDQVHVVEFADYRQYVRRKPIDRAFNLRDRGGQVFGPTAGNYLTPTIKLSFPVTPWTWQEMVTALWDACISTSSAAGSPTLPYTPHGTPEGFDFFGWPSALDALEYVLTRIDCSLVYDPRGTGTSGNFYIRRAADGIATLTAFHDKQKVIAWNDLQEQWPAAEWPEKIKVRFRASPVPYQGFTYWEYVTVTTPTPPAVVTTQTTLTLDDDLYAVAPAGVPNTALKNARAAERAAEYVRRRSSIERPTLRSYKGVVPEAFDLLGEVVQFVAVSDRGGDDGAALCTEIGAAQTFDLATWRAKQFDVGPPTIAKRIFVTSVVPDVVGRVQVSYDFGYVDAVSVIVGPWTIKGRVTQAGVGVEAAAVYASSGQRVLTDSNGDYTLTGIPAGTQRVIINTQSPLTSTPAVQNVTVGPNATGIDFTIA